MTLSIASSDTSSQGLATGVGVGVPARAGAVLARPVAIEKTTAKHKLRRLIAEVLTLNVLLSFGLFRVWRSPSGTTGQNGGFRKLPCQSRYTSRVNRLTLLHTDRERGCSRKIG